MNMDERDSAGIMVDKIFAILHQAGEEATDSECINQIRELLKVEGGVR